MPKNKSISEDKVTFNISKSENFSEWFTEILKRAEIVDVRYNIKGFLVHRPWSVLAIEKMYKHMEKVLQRKGHMPHFFPTIIPEKNLKKESAHIGGFTPQVFWITQGGDNKFEGKYALRPTSETAVYQMFSLWIRSYNDLPFKTYQRAQVFRYDTKATRPLLRDREFYWIEAHCAHKTEKDALNQVKEDMETTKEVLHDIFGLPFMFFERPQWDKFPGAARTFAADVMNPDGKLVQQPSTHLISQEFSKAFDVKFKDKDSKEKYAHTTCYGPAMSRILASVIITHGDDKGLRFPWKIAPKQVVITTIGKEKSVIKKAEELKNKLEEQNIDTTIDSSDSRPGEKFYYWEMKGVPLRIELGKNEVAKKELTIFRRDTEKKSKVKESKLIEEVNKLAKEYDKNLFKVADNLFKNRIVDAKSREDVKTAIEAGKIARCNFCSTSKDGTSCAEIVEKEINAEVRGTKLAKEKPESGSKCVFCSKPAKELVYIGRSY